MRDQLVERAMRGDREAFTSLAHDRADRCYALAYRILRDPHRAQDAVQQALLVAWRDLPTLRDPDRFDAWLLKLVVNACYTESRTERRWSARVRVIAIEPLIEPDIARSVATRDELEQAFKRLTTEQRTVVSRRAISRRRRSRSCSPGSSSQTHPAQRHRPLPDHLSAPRATGLLSVRASRARLGERPGASNA